MTALSADYKAHFFGEYHVIPLAITASTTIYLGSLVSIVTATGLAVASTDGAGEVFMGVALEQKTSAATGTTYIKVGTCGIAQINSNLTVAQTHMGVKVVVKDSSIVTNAAGATNDIPVGIVVGIPTVGGSLLDVYIGPGAGLGGTA
jgi:hypothetical protein